MAIYSRSPSFFRNRFAAHMLAIFLFFFSTLFVQAQTADRPVDPVVAAHYPPLMVANNESAPGMAVEIIEIAANRAGRAVTVEFVPFQRAMFSLQQRSDTLMPALFKNTERSPRFQWISQVYAEDLRFLSTDKSINSLKDARALRQIVVESGSSSARFLVERGFDNLVFVNSPDASAQMLASGRVQAWFLTEELGEAIWRQFGYKEELFHGDILHSLPVFLVAGLGFPSEVAKSYQDAIKSMQEDGTIDALRTKYYKFSS